MILCLPGKPVLKRITERQTMLQQRYVALLALIEQRKPALISVLDSAAAAPIRSKTFKPVYRVVPARSIAYALALFLERTTQRRISCQKFGKIRLYRSISRSAYFVSTSPALYFFIFLMNRRGIARAPEGKQPALRRRSLFGERCSSSLPISYVVFSDFLRMFSRPFTALRVDLIAVFLSIRSLILAELVAVFLAIFALIFAPCFLRFVGHGAAPHQA